MYRGRQELTSRNFHLICIFLPVYWLNFVQCGEPWDATSRRRPASLPRWPVWEPQPEARQADGPERSRGQNEIYCRNFMYPRFWDSSSVGTLRSKILNQFKCWNIKIERFWRNCISHRLWTVLKGMYCFYNIWTKLVKEFRSTNEPPELSVFKSFHLTVLWSLSRCFDSNFDH